MFSIIRHITTKYLYDIYMKYIYNEGKMQELVVILQNSSALDMIRIVLSLVFGVDRVPYLASGLKKMKSLEYIP